MEEIDDNKKPYLDKCILQNESCTERTPFRIFPSESRMNITSFTSNFPRPIQTVGKMSMFKLKKES